MLCNGLKKVACFVWHCIRALRLRWLELHTAILKRVFWTGWSIGSAWRDVQSVPEWVSTDTRGGGAGLETVSSPQETRHWSQERHSGLTINHRSHYTENYLMVMNDTLSQCRHVSSFFIMTSLHPHLLFLRNDFSTCYTGNYNSTYIPFHTLGRVRTASVFGLSPFTTQLFSYLLLCLS